MYRLDNDISKTIVMFTQATNKLFNQMGRIPNAIKQKKIGSAIGILTSLFIAGGWIGFVSKRPPDDEEEKKNPGATANYWLYNFFLSQPVESIPFIGGTISSMLQREPRLGGGIEYATVTTAGSAITNMIKAMDAEKSEEVRRDYLISGIENMTKTLGLTVGLPGTAPVRIERAVIEQDPTKLWGW
jgi:hypothetical protein